MNDTDISIWWPITRYRRWKFRERLNLENEMERISFFGFLSLTFEFNRFAWNIRLLQDINQIHQVFQPVGQPNEVIGINNVEK